MPINSTPQGTKACRSLNLKRHTMQRRLTTILLRPKLNLGHSVPDRPNYFSIPSEYH